MAFTGDTKRLQRLVAGFGRLGKRGLADKVMRAISEEAVALVQECFEESRDPYGKPWAKLRSRDGMPLMDTGRLRASITRSSVSRGGFVIGTNVKYAGLHNYGGVIKPVRAKALRFKVRGKFVQKQSVTIPRRQFFPDSGRTPSAWKETFEEVAREIVDQELRP